MAKAEITVEVTDAIHSAFRDVAQRIYDQHGILVKDVIIEWLDPPTWGRSSYRVQKVETRATKVYLGGSNGETPEGSGND